MRVITPERMSREGMMDAGLALMALRGWTPFTERSVDDVVGALDRLETPVLYVPFTLYPEGNPSRKGPQRQMKNVFELGLQFYGPLFPVTAPLTFDRALVQGPGYASLDIRLDGFSPTLQLKIPEPGAPKVNGSQFTVGATRYAIGQDRAFAFMLQSALPRASPDEPVVRVERGHLFMPYR